MRHFLKSMIKKTINTLIILATMLPLLLYLYRFNGFFFNEHRHWSEFGSYIGGIYGCLAFIVLALTFDLSRKQFKSQSEDLFFFKLVEAHKEINNNIIKKIGSQTEKVTALQITEDFKTELHNQSVALARNILRDDPRSVSLTHYMKIYESIYGEQSIERSQNFMNRLIDSITSLKTNTEKWNELKDFIGYADREPPELKDALRALGCVNFYLINPKTRFDYYKRATNNLSFEFGYDYYFDSILNNFKFISEFIESSERKKFYLKYLKSQLTRYEIINLFYILSGSDRETESIDKYSKILQNIFSELRNQNSRYYMIDFPSEKQIETEIDYLFSQKNDA